VKKTPVIHRATRHNTPIHNILLTAQLSISQKALGMLAEDGYTENNFINLKIGVNFQVPLKQSYATEVTYN
jgi:hypothetical protein